MDAALLEHYMRDGSRRGAPIPGGHDGTAGSAACGDLVRFSLRIGGGRVAGLTHEAAGCGSTVASAAAAAEMADGAPVLDAARISPAAIAAALGGVPPSKLHAVELAADALHRSLSAAVTLTSGALAEPADRAGRVLVAMSGGVDSAVAALDEIERERDVVGVTLKLWQDSLNDGGRSCCSPEAVLSARGLAHRLGIPHLTLDLRDSFGREVVGAFVEGYAGGTTPNPCVRCNGHLRIDAMLALADRVGAATLVTGHYARLSDDGEGTLLVAHPDRAKDQSYMLSAVSPQSLLRLRFPLADSRKPEVRERAERAGLPVARKPESQDLCFLAGEGKRRFLARHGGLADRDGDFVDRRGRRLGRHRGHQHFTVGQRRGIGVGGGEPLYVLAKDRRTNTVTVGPREALRTERVRVGDPSLWRDAARIDGVRLRSHAEVVPCRAEDRDWGLELHLEDPVLGVAPGQTACLLDGELVIGSGTILGPA